MAFLKKLSFFIPAAALVLALILSPSITIAKQENPFDLDIVDDSKYISNLETLQPVHPLTPEDPNGFVDVPPDHWAYKAVKYLTDIGLLGGYDENRFRGDRPVTRYELSLIISKLVKNYNDYLKTGNFGEEISSPPTIQAQQTGEPAARPAAATPVEPIEPTAAIKKSDSIAESSPGLPSVQGAASPFLHGKMKTLGPPAQDKSKQSAASQPQSGQDAAKDNGAKNGENGKKNNPPPKEFDKLAKKVELTDKDVEILKALIDYLSKDYAKQVTKSLEDNLRKIDRLGQQNKQDVLQLKQDIERFKITGSGSAEYNSTDNSNGTSDAGVSSSASWGWFSKPSKYEDMTLSDIGNVAYSNYKAYRDTNKNFKLRTLTGGRNTFGVLVTPLVTSEVKYKGFRTELSLNKYTIISSIGKVTNNDWVVEENNYINATSLQFSLFNEPKSLSYLSHIQTWQDADKVVDSNSWNGSSWVTSKPAQKNSATSLAIRYPLPFKGFYVTTEFAHSTNHRPGFNFAFPGKYNVQKDPKEPSKDMPPSFLQSDQFNKWIRIPNQTYQDEAFFLFLDYAKGPLTIFPAGYLRIGPHYYSRYLGLPGMSLSDFGVSVLPISLQSLELWAFIGNYKRIEKKYEDEFRFASAKETKPMFLDTSAAVGSADALIGFNLFGRLNNRPKDALINLSYFYNKLTFYQSDKITYSWAYSTAKAGLGPSCIDTNSTYVYDDQHNAVDAFIGNGIADCNPNSPTFDGDLSMMLRFLIRSQEFNLFWRTSTRADLSMKYKYDDMRLNVESNDSAITGAVKGLFKQGRTYNLETKLMYRLTNVSNIEFWFNTNNIPKALELQDSSKLFSTVVGAKINMSF